MNMIYRMSQILRMNQFQRKKRERAKVKVKPTRKQKMSEFSVTPLTQKLGADEA